MEQESKNFHNNEPKKFENANNIHQAQLALGTRLTGVIINNNKLCKPISPQSLVGFTANMKLTEKKKQCTGYLMSLCSLSSFVN